MFGLFVGRADAQTPDPAANAQPSTRYDAELDAFNDLHGHYVLSDEFGDYLAASRHWLPPQAKAGSGSRLVFNLRPFDTTEQKLQAALSLPGTAPDIDPAAQKLLDTLRVLDPLLRKMSRYVESRGFQDDNYALARATHPALVAAVKATFEADKGMKSALYDHAIAADQQAVDAAPEGLPRLLLADRLAIRQAERRVRDLKAHDDTTALSSAVTALSGANQALADKLDGFSPPIQGYCGSFLHMSDVLLGDARQQMQRARAGQEPEEIPSRFDNTFVIAVSDLDMCRRFEPRARP